MRIRLRNYLDSNGFTLRPIFSASGNHSRPFITVYNYMYITILKVVTLYRNEIQKAGNHYGIIKVIQIRHRRFTIKSCFRVRHFVF